MKAKAKLSSRSKLPSDVLRERLRNADSFQLADIQDPTDPAVLDLLGALMVAGGLFYLGHQVGPPLADIARSVKDIANVVVKVGDQIIRLGDRIEELVDEIKRLLEELKGEISLSHLRDSLADVRTALQAIESKAASPERARLYICELSAAELLLHGSINRVINNSKGGASAFIQISPALGVWAQTFLLVQRIKFEDKEIPVSSVWKQPFHIETARILKAFFVQARKTVNRLRGVQGQLDMLAGNVAEFKGGRFVLSDVPRRERYGARSLAQGRPNLFRTARDQLGGVDLQSTVEERVILNNGSRDFVWISTNYHCTNRGEIITCIPSEPFFPDEVHVKKAKKAHQDCRAIISKGAHSLKFLEKFDDVEKLFYEAITEPAEWKNSPA